MPLLNTMAVVPAAELIEEINALRMQNIALAGENARLLEENLLLMAHGAKIAENARLRMLSPEGAGAGDDRLLIDMVKS